MSAAETAVDQGAARMAYDQGIEFDQVPAAEAVRQLAALVADALGTGEADDGGYTNGLLDVPVKVTAGGVFGHEVAVTVQRPHADVEVILGDDALPLEQLVGVLKELSRHCISPRILR